MRALLWKELREQFGRWLPATILMTGVFFLLVRARLVSIRETVILIDVIGGCILSVLLMVETFPTERTRGTMNFLYARPVPPQRIWFAKWFAAGLSIVAMQAVATLAGLIAAVFVDVDLGWFALATLCVCVSMLAFQTAAMSVLMQAKNEIEAALGAASVAVLSCAWAYYNASENWWFQRFCDLSPAAPLFNFMREMRDFVYRQHRASHTLIMSVAPEQDYKSILLSICATVAIWIILPGILMTRHRECEGSVR